MRKNSLATSVVASLVGLLGLAHISTAVNVSSDGVGQVLIFPYYTINNDQATLLSVVNTTDDVKAVKVRFLSSETSAAPLDFNLYLSPFDTWTGGVVNTGGPSASLVSSDTSCTVPAIGGGLTLPSREGFLEMIEMGRVVDDGDVSASGGASGLAQDPTPGDTGGRLATALRHGANGAAADCQAVRTAFESGQWRANGGQVGRDIDEPNGGLFGGGAIINVPQGTNIPYTPVALSGFYQLNNEAGGTASNLHTAPGSTLPNLGSAADDAGVGGAQALIAGRDGLVTMDFETGLEAVDAVLASAGLVNEFNSQASLAGATDWVVTLPTRRLHASGNAGPFSAASCESAELRFFDREEQPGGTRALNLCKSSNVIAFNTTGTGLFGAPGVTTVQLVGPDGQVDDAGWAHLNLGVDANNDGINDRHVVGLPTGINEAQAVEGLPAIGFSANNYVNGNVANGVLANYGAYAPHRIDKRVRDVNVDGQGRVTGPAD